MRLGIFSETFFSHFPPSTTLYHFIKLSQLFWVRVPAAAPLDGVERIKLLEAIKWIIKSKVSTSLSSFTLTLNSTVSTVNWTCNYFFYSNIEHIFYAFPEAELMILNSVRKDWNLAERETDFQIKRKLLKFHLEHFLFQIFIIFLFHLILFFNNPIPLDH